MNWQRLFAVVGIICLVWFCLPWPIMWIASKFCRQGAGLEGLFPLVVAGILILILKGVSVVVAIGYLCYSAGKDSRDETATN